MSLTEILETRVIDWIDGNIYKSKCLACGAVVHDRRVHARWHLGLSPR